MANLTNDQLADVRRQWAELGGVVLEKPAVNAAIQAIDDFYESAPTQQGFAMAVLGAVPGFPQERIVDLVRAWANNRVKR